MQTSSWGILPSRAEFDALFEAEMGDARYEIRHGSPGPLWRPRAGLYSRSELWELLQRLMQAEADMDWEGKEDTPGNWASSILYTLGWEWI